jgi:hypothetical protein
LTALDDEQLMAATFQPPQVGVPLLVPVVVAHHSVFV